ncbi:MAG: nucleotidyltransferase domain-containing protein [Polaromonas sp.]
MDKLLQEVLACFPGLMLALVFGSVAKGSQHADSDVDISVAANQALTAADKMVIIEALGRAHRTFR